MRFLARRHPRAAAAAIAGALFLAGALTWGWLAGPVLHLDPNVGALSGLCIGSLWVLPTLTTYDAIRSRLAPGGR